MSSLAKKAAVRAARLARIQQAATVQEAGRIGRCLSFCEKLEIEEFDFNSLAKSLDLQTTLGTTECLVTWVPSPEGFVVLSQDQSFLSPMIEIEERLIWSFDKEAKDYVTTPKILDKQQVRIFAHRSGY